MAIDRMKRVTIVAQVASSQRLIRTLHELGIVELIDADEQIGEAGQGRLQRLEASTEESDRQIHKIGMVLGLLDRFAPEEKSFFEGLTPLPLVIEPEELDRTLKTFDLEPVYAAAQELEETHRRAERSLHEAQTLLRELAPFESLGVSLHRLAALEKVGLVFGLMPAKAFATLKENATAGEILAWEEVEGGDPVKLVVAFLREHEEAARRLLSDLGLEEASLPAVAGSVAERMEELRADATAAEERLAEVESRMRDLAEQRRPLNVMKAFWEGNRNKSIARSASVSGKWVHILCGYIRSRDLPTLQEVLRQDFPEASLTVDEPALDENVPVSITLPRSVRPIQLLVNMFGLPLYRSFDPSPFLVFNFYLFFGICFGDVGYGLMLILLSLFLRSKTRDYPGVYNFSTLFLYAGISTTIFGALFGSWLGDLWKTDYLGEDNFLLAMKNAIFVLDPLAKPVTALVLALMVGMLNQFYAISLKMYGALKGRDFATAVFDGFLWLITLPGLAIIVSGMFADLSPGLFRIGMSLVVLGAVGLVLTQGRNEKGVFGKCVTGFVSLYGIVGSYGCTSFIGDTLSYCRLLALGLTTSIVAMSVNMMAGMLRDVPYVGMVLFVVLLVFGHLFNFSISVLGAFVHSIRLIFVEFFGRFYVGGARPFRPLGFDTPAFVLKKRA